MKLYASRVQAPLLFCDRGRCTKTGARACEQPLLRPRKSALRRLLGKTGHFHQNPPDSAFFKLIRAFRFTSLHVTNRRFRDGGGFGEDKKKNHSLHDATRNGPVLSPRKRQKSQKSHPPGLEPPQLGFLWNFLGLLRVTECNRAHGRKSSAGIIVRVSARAKNGRQCRPVQHQNRRAGERRPATDVRSAQKPKEPRCAQRDSVSRGDTAGAVAVRMAVRIAAAAAAPPPPRALHAVLSRQWHRRTHHLKRW